MSIPLPEQNSVHTIAQATLIGILGSIPVAGGALSGAIQGAAEAASRERDEEFWAMLAARLTSLEREVQEAISFRDPDFVAALHRLLRAARETADDERRSRLAAALAHSGSWSDLPLDDRERMERLLIDVSSREIAALRFIPEMRQRLEPSSEWFALMDETILRGRDRPAMDGHEAMLLDEALVRELTRGDSVERRRLASAVRALESRGLIEGTMTGINPLLLMRHLTETGAEFLSYLDELGI